MTSTIWAIVGLVFIFSELVIPGGIVVFLGLAALFVAMGIHFEFVNNWVHAMTAWFLISLIMIISLRGIAQKLVGGDESVSNTDEDIDAIGMMAAVVEEISSDETGRIRFNGTTWLAKGKNKDDDFAKDTTVVILGRDNVTWIVGEKKEEGC